MFLTGLSTTDAIDSVMNLIINDFLIDY